MIATRTETEAGEVVDCTDCVQQHTYPAIGTIVRTIPTAVPMLLRIPGTETYLEVPSGALGRVRGYVVEWHDVVVAFAALDGQEVWVDVDHLVVPS